MDTFFSQAFTLLTTPPGNLVYRVILVFSVFGALQMFARHWQDPQNHAARRMAGGLGMLLFVQLALFIAAGLAWQGLIDAHKILPVLVWGATLLSILWMIWLWAFPDPVRSVDAAVLLLSVLILTLTVLAVVWWSAQNPMLYFNGSLADKVATILGMALTFLGIVLLAVRRPFLWGFGLAAMIILFLGCLLHWLMPYPDSDYAGIIRLAELAAFPLLLALPQRISATGTVSEKALPASKQKTTRGQIETDPKLLQTFFTLATETDLGKVYQGISRAYAQLMVADMCLLALPPDATNQIMVPVGYDLIMDRNIEGFAINAQNMPLLANVLRRGRNLRLPANSNSVDLVNLAKSLGVEQAGNLLAVAVSPKGSPPALSIILLSPYSKRSWSAQDQQRLIDTTAPMASILQRAKYDAQLMNEMEKAKAQAEAAQSTTAQVERIQSELEQEQNRTATLTALVAGLEAKAISLEKRASRSQTAEEAAQTQGELNLALAEIARLRAEIANQNRLRQRLPGETPSEEKLKTLAVIAQEFHRPVDSINGQCDLLLSETLGPLGVRQRKTLERLKAASERIRGLVDEVVDITTLDNGAKDLVPTRVDLTTVIDEALAGLIPDLSARNIALRVDLPDMLPELYADRQAVLQVLYTLLKNAGDTTSPEGEVCFRARVESKENERGYLLMQVSRSGESIPADELPRVFSHQFRDEDSTAQTEEVISDLAKAKSLVEAHGGRVWVDSEPGQGATFSVLLPLPEWDTRQGIGGGFEG